MDFNAISIAGISGCAYAVARAIGKNSNSYIVGIVINAPVNIRKWLGVALLPQAGIAIGLVISLQSIPGFKDYADLLTAITLSAVILNEIFGPAATSYALVKSGEAGKDRGRLSCI